MAQLEYVNKGDAILAQQYNNLVDAIGGPTNPSNNMPFTQTKNGIVFNNGIEKYETKAAAQIPKFLEVKATTGQVGEGYSIYNAQDVAANRFEGVYANVGSPANFAELCWKCLNGTKSGSSLLVIIDPTTNQPAIVPYGVGLQQSLPSGILPICKRQENAGFALVQVTATSDDDVHQQRGYAYAFIGNFEKFGAGQGYGNRADLVPRQNWINVIKTLDSTVQDARLIFFQTVWKATQWFGGDNFPKLTYTIGTQNVEMLPDAYVSKNVNDGGVNHSMRLDTQLSSIDVVPSKQVGFDDIWTSNTFQLFDFDKKDSTADDLSTIIESNQLSSYDVLVKHKGPHPKTADDPTFDTQCSAVLEYMPISSLIGGSNHTGDANLSSHQLSSVYLSSDGQYELFNFHLSGTQYGLTKYDWQYGLSNDIEVVVRDNTTQGQSKVNYIPKSWLSAVGGDVNVIDTRRSVEYVNNPDPYYQLYRFGDDSTINLDPIEHHGGFDFVVRYHNAVSQREEIQYGKLDLSAIAPISGDANIIPNAQKSIITVEDLQGNKWQQLYGLGDTGVISAVMGYDGDDHYIMNEGNSWTNPNKQFLYYDYLDKRLKYGDICLYMPKVKASDLDDDVIPEISDVIIPEVSVMISAELSALDDRYWIKGEDETENYGSAIGDNNGNIAIDLNNKYLYNNSRVAISLNDYQLNGNTYDYWKTPNLSATRNITAGNQVTAPTIWATGSGATLKIGNTTLNESQLQQLLALLNAPQRLQQL